MKSTEKLPNLLIIGTHKSGTTSLFEYLNLHSSVFCPLVKEIHFFTDLIYQRQLTSLMRYRNYYADSNCLVNVDCSPSYFYADENIIKEMKKYLGKFKIILLLREPKDRIISFYKNQVKRVKIPGNESLNEFLFKSIKQAEEYLSTGIIYDDPYNRGVRESLYGHYIGNWYNQMDKEAMKIIFFEELISNTTTTLNSICKWLDIEPIYNDSFNYVQHNKAMTYKNKFVHKLSVKYFRKYESLIRKSGLKSRLSIIYNAINSKNIDSDLSINEENNSKLNNLLINDKILLRTFVTEKFNQPVPDWLK